MIEVTGTISISEVTRRNIFDELSVAGISWHGRLSEIEFLSRLYNLNKLPSTDFRSHVSDAEADIYQHRVMNSDWGHDWVYADSRFDLMKGPDETFLRFLCEMLHPVVRLDEDECENLLSIFNIHLNKDGWEIAITGYISSKPVFSARRLFLKMDHSINTLKDAVTGLSVEYISQQITRMQSSIESDPELAIGTAKELVETCCKTILSEKGIAYDSDADLPKLMRLTQEILNLLPENIDDAVKGVHAVKRVLGSFANMTQGMAELRGLYGTGHGKGGKSTAIEPRHAKLAVGAATTLAIFLFETYYKAKGQ
jgi:hypothetical protein